MFKELYNHEHIHNPQNLAFSNLQSTKRALPLTTDLGFAACSLWRRPYPMLHAYFSKITGMFPFQKVLFTSLTFIWLQIFNTDPAPCRAVIKKLHMDTSGFPFSSDYRFFRRMVVYQTRPPRITFHLGPDQVTGRILTADTAQTTDV